MLIKFKMLLGITSNEKDFLLNELLDQSVEFFKSYTHQEVINESIVIQIAVYRYNMLSNEGLNSESYSGMNFNYSQDLPEHLYKQLKPYRKVKFK